MRKLKVVLEVVLFAALAICGVWMMAGTILHRDNVEWVGRVTLICALILVIRSRD